MLLSYLKRHYKIIIMLALFSAVFAGVFALYDLPVEAVLYAALLCLVAGAALFFIGYGGYLRKHRALRDILRRSLISLDGLPDPAGALEEDYQQLLRALWDSRSALEAKSAAESREQTDYYALWAHQIKTPIAAMRLLLQRADTPENSELSGELFRVEQYVEMALSYVRLGSETSDHLLRRYLLDDILRGCIRKYSRQFIRRGVGVEFAETGLMVYTDGKWLSFVIEQVLSNSLKYTPRGGKVSLRAQERTLFITDTGIGIRAEDLPRVFEKGFTGYNGREDRKSTGIGLYLCRRVCERLGHGIAIASDVGRGTTVSLVFDTRERVME